MSQYAGPWKVYLRQRRFNIWDWKVVFARPDTHEIGVTKHQGTAFSRKGALQHVKRYIRDHETFPNHEWSEVNMREVWDA